MISRRKRQSVNKRENEMNEKLINECSLIYVFAHTHKHFCTIHARTSCEYVYN